MRASALALACLLHAADALRLELKDKPKDAVLATAWGYDPVVARNFLCSLRRTGYEGDVLLFVSENENPKTIEMMKTYGATVINSPFNTTDVRVKGRLAQIDACKDGNYRYCLMADFRDVYFQEEPFARYPEGQDLVFAQESAQVGTLDDSESNKKWVNNCLKVSAKYKHPEVYREISNDFWARPVICTGTIAGTPAGLMALGQAMRDGQQTLPNCHSHGSGGQDQPLINIVLHWAGAEPDVVPSMKGKSFVVQKQGSGGMINTMGGLNDADGTLKLNAEGHVMEADGVTPSAVVHQYDRADRQEWVNKQMESCQA